MKKFLSLLLTVMMLLGCLPAMAEDAADWKINKTTQLVARKSAAKKVDHIVVPAEVDGVAVRGLEYMCFNMYKNFKQLTLPGSAVMLDRSTTRDLPNLETVELGDSLIVIREGNFTNLPKLTSVVLPASVALVHSSFNKCASLTSITFEGVCPVFVAEGSYDLFTELPADCVIYVPDDQVDAYKAALADREDVVARIQPSGQRAVRVDRTADESEFQFDASTGTITGYTGAANYLRIPASIGGVPVKHIAAWSEVGKGLCCVVIPEGVETIGEYSFAGIKLLSYVSLPSTLTSVGECALSGSYLSGLAYGGDSVPGYSADAFQRIDGDWRMILPYGSSQELVNGFAAYLAETAPKCAVMASIIEPYTFPALDAEAGAPFIGTWNAVAVTDGTDFYGMDLLGISVAADLQADGTGVVDLDGDAAPGGWYVEDGTAIFAPILEEGGQPVPEEGMPFTMDENGRMCLDLGGLILLMELEGAVYATPAIPERPWPEFSLDNAQAFVGTWEATGYEVEGETYPAELLGVMVLTLNNDGTALMTEPGEEPYVLQWYADYGIAYVGPAMSDLAEITFDGNGSIEMVQDGMTVILAPYVEAYVIQGADELLGDWYDDVGNKLTLVNDGTLTHTYAFDGWVDTYEWDVVNGAAVVTEGPWSGLPITLENGILIITNDEGIFQIFSRDGDLSAYYGEDESELPEAQPIGEEGAAYFGSWQYEIMPGMAMVLTLNPDGTCEMDMMGETEPGVWALENGKAYVMGDEIHIDGDGNLVMPSMDMVFAKVGSAQTVPAPSLPEGLEGYVGTWHLCYAATGGLTGDLRSMGLTGMLVLHADGTGVMTSLSEESGSWYDDEGQVRFGESGMPIFLLEDGFLRYGTELSGYMVFSQDEAAVWTPAAAATPAPTPAPTAAPQAPVTGDVAHLNTRFVCRTYTSAGYTMDASMLGAEYALVFHDNGTADFTMAGFTAVNLPYTVTAEGVYAINYYGTMFNCTPTASGFDMDFYGTMMMHFVPAE